MPTADDRDTTYGRAFANDYDRLYGEREEIDRIVSVLASLADGGRALEYGVGTGRLALPLARTGLSVVGVDSSPAMLEVLRSKPDSDLVTVVEGDLSTVAVDGRFSLVFTAFSTLFLLADQDAQVRAFENAARHLSVGGVFLVESFVHDRSTWSSSQELVVTDLSDEAATIRVGRLAAAAQEIRTLQVEIDPGGIRTRPNRLRFAYPSEMDLMARIAGLRLRERWSDWAGSPFTDASRNQVALYEKPGS
jgi:SAM-dependent methyltransferase